MKKLLVFDIWGDFGHFKQIFATTSALTYPFPFKTAIYGMIGAITGLSKEGNDYLNYFPPGQCRVGLHLLSPVKTQRLNINLSPDTGPIRSNRKPTMMEFVCRPKYRIFFFHENEVLTGKLKTHLESHSSVFTVSLGLANLLANFHYLGEFEFELRERMEGILHGIIATDNVIALNSEAMLELDNEIVEVSQYATEMDHERNVTKRTKVLYDRNGKPVYAKLNQCIQVFDFPDQPILHLSML